MALLSLIIGYTLGYEITGYIIKKIQDCYNIPST
jgi:hypothetical protein